MLVVLFNQDFSRNIPALHDIYSNRFSEIVYLVPDHHSVLREAYTKSRIDPRVVYAADKVIKWLRTVLGRRNPYALDSADQHAFRKSIIRVVGHQYYFYHFVVQAAERLLDSDANWFWFVGDDALINPYMDESTLWGLISDDSNYDYDAAICTPVIGSDSWLGRIGRDVNHLARSLNRALGSASAWARDYSLSADDGAHENQTIAVWCADFFGLSRELLIELVPLLRRCFHQKIFVEVALPNAVMSLTNRAVFLSNFSWQRVSTPDQHQLLMAVYLDDRTSVFTHPIKLSMCTDEEVERIRTLYG